MSYGKYYLTFALVILFVFVSVAATNYTKEESVKTSGSSGTKVKTIVSESNVEGFLSSQSMIRELPNSANVQLVIGEKTYAVAKGNVKEGLSDNPDITISVPAKYMSEMGNGLCSTLRKASRNGDLSYVLHISKISAGWKYNSLFKYKDCL